VTIKERTTRMTDEEKTTLPTPVPEASPDPAPLGPFKKIRFNPHEGLQVVFPTVTNELRDSEAQ
jgi:hypothetical protein